MAEDELKLRVVLDPNGLQSQLSQLKQEIGLTVQGALSSAGGSIGVASHAAGMLAGDVSGALGSVLSAPRTPDDVTVGGIARNALYATFPSITAPHSYDVQRWGQQNAERFSNLSGSYAMNLTHGLGRTLADWGAFSVGMDLTVAAMGGMAMTPMGVAAGVAGMGAGMAMGHLGGETYDRMFSRSIVGAASRGIVTNMGERWGVKPSDDIIRGIQDIHAGGGYSIDQTTSVLSMGLQTGAFGQVRGAEDFKSKFDQLMKGAKDIAHTMNMSMEDAAQTIAQIQGAGFGSIQNVVSSLNAARVMARATGIPGSEANELMMAGAGMTMGTGFSATWGASNVATNFAAVTAGLRAKSGSLGALDEEHINQLGGRSRAAMAMTQANMAWLEGPIGRATLLASYDPNTGHLTSGIRPGFEPGMAYRQAIDVLRGTDNPMSALLEFAGRRGQVASEMSPEQTALARVGMGVSMAKMAGKLTKETILGSMVQMGMNPDEAAAQLSLALNDRALLDKQQAILKETSDQTSRQEQKEVTTWSSLGALGETIQGTFSEAGSYLAGTRVGQAVGATASTVGQVGYGVLDAATGGGLSGIGRALGSRELSQAGRNARNLASFSVDKGVNTAGGVFSTAGNFIQRGYESGLDYLRRSPVVVVPSSLSSDALFAATRGEGVLGKMVSKLSTEQDPEAFSKAARSMTVELGTFLDAVSPKGPLGGTMLVNQASREFFAKNLEDFVKLASLSPQDAAGDRIMERLSKLSDSFGGDTDLRKEVLKNARGKSAELTPLAAASRLLFEELSANSIINDTYDSLGGQHEDSAFGREYRSYIKAVEDKGGEGGSAANRRSATIRGVLAAAEDEGVRRGAYGGLFTEAHTILQRMGPGPGGEISVADLTKLKRNFISDGEIKEMAGEDGKVSKEELAAHLAAELSVFRRGQLGASSVSGGASPETNADLRSMLANTSRALQDVSGLLTTLKESKLLASG